MQHAANQFPPILGMRKMKIYCDSFHYTFKLTHKGQYTFSDWLDGSRGSKQRSFLKSSNQICGFLLLCNKSGGAFTVGTQSHAKEYATFTMKETVPTFLKGEISSQGRFFYLYLFIYNFEKLILINHSERVPDPLCICFSFFVFF